MRLGRSGFALLSGLALACATTGTYASSGTVYGEVHNATTLAPATKGSASLTINGAPWGATATIDATGQFNFGVVTWLTGSATIVISTSGTEWLDGSAQYVLASGGTVDAFINVASGSSISGTVTDSATNQPIPAGAVIVFDANGVMLGSAAVGAAGTYEYTGLVAGSYYARTDEPDYLDLVWNGVACPGGACIATSGTPIVVPDETSNEIADFQLDLDLIFGNGFETP